MSRNWTDEQRACIDARGGTVLVSAAAGSGKTSVLVERVIQRITDDEHPVDADRLLVVTFTKAAAAEMKQRLSAALTKKIAADPFNRRLQRQQMLLPRAQISTVHSFCSSLLRDNFHLLGISPRFQVAAEADVKLLRQEALGEVLEAAYAEKDPGFTRLADLILGARGDRPLRDAVTRLYDFIQSHAFPEEWMARQEARYADADPTGSDWGGAVHGYVLQALLYSLSLMRAAEEMAIADEAMNAAYGPTFTAERQMLQDAAGAFADADWDTGRAICRGIAFGRLPGLRNYPDPAYKERVTDLRGRAKKTAESLGNLLCGTAAECRQDVASTRPVVSALCALVRAFSDRYEQKKAERRWVDFNDLEHMALRLLLTKDENGDTARTPLARELAAYYEEVLVDEYQDTNEAQDALFRAVSRDETNLFMVGDVKQSIYGFRQAMPEIFLRRQDFYLPYDGRHFPAAITLGHNFRSRKEVTDGVNFVFSQLMSRDLGGLTYDERHALIYSAQGYSDAPGYQTELCLIDDDREDLDTKDAAEARWIAGRIHELLPTLRIKSEDGDRPAQYGDFCILLRSKSSHAAAYVEELNRQGIPAWTDVSGGFFGAPEVASAVALLRLLDNPTQDVSLLAVLLSPIGNFLPDDLAILRSHRR
ncbi:MAG: UvrD-helicase domain-containing protein, partial [Acutalibacteraceae bacterium]